jgi:flagellar biosynthetic protein FlhB
MMALAFAGGEIWQRLALSMSGVLGHLHDLPLTEADLPGYLLGGALGFAQTVAAPVMAAMIGGLLAGAVQSRFRTAPEALEPNWERLNPVEGFKRIFSAQSAVPTLLATLKLSVVVVLTYQQILGVLQDPIFTSTVDAARIAQFLAQASFKIILRIAGALAVIAALDYAYQFYKNQQELMMTREEVKEELKNTEGNAQVKARQRRRRRATQRKMLQEVVQADVVVTNPTHLAIALRYDRKHMNAPRIVAKGSRLNAQRIREIAAQHQVPIIENKPLARMLFKYGRVGLEIPVQLYGAVAEILAWAYRVNRYRYYAEQNQINA